MQVVARGGELHEPCAGQALEHLAGDLGVHQPG
jgi:hypothetical protein